MQQQNRSVWSTVEQIGQLLAQHPHEVQHRILRGLSTICGIESALTNALTWTYVPPTVEQVAEARSKPKKVPSAKLLSIRDAAKEAGKHEATIAYHVAKGTIPSVKRGKRKFIRPDELSAYLRRAKA